MLVPGLARKLNWNLQKYEDNETRALLLINRRKRIARFGDRLFYPGDALYNPKLSVEILALPVAGLWLKISDAVDYAKQIKPKFAFPVHDALINSNLFTGHHKIPEIFLPKIGIDFKVLELQKEYIF